MDTLNLPGSRFLPCRVGTVMFSRPLSSECEHQGGWGNSPNTGHAACSPCLVPQSWSLSSGGCSEVPPGGWEGPLRSREEAHLPDSLKGPHARSLLWGRCPGAWATSLKGQKFDELV